MAATEAAATAQARYAPQFYTSHLLHDGLVGRMAEMVYGPSDSNLRIFTEMLLSTDESIVQQCISLMGVLRDTPTQRDSKVRLGRLSRIADLAFMYGEVDIGAEFVTTFIEPVAPDWYVSANVLDNDPTALTYIPAAICSSGLNPAHKYAYIAMCCASHNYAKHHEPRVITNTEIGLDHMVALVTRVASGLALPKTDSISNSMTTTKFARYVLVERHEMDPRTVHNIIELLEDDLFDEALKSVVFSTDITLSQYISTLFCVVGFYVLAIAGRNQVSAGFNTALANKLNSAHTFIKQILDFIKKIN